MGKYFGKIGYKTSVETEPGLWEPLIVERPYYGDTLRNYIRNAQAFDMTTSITSPKVNSNISIIADPYAFEQAHNMVYAEYMGAKWTIDSIDPQYPRILITLGGLYDGYED